MPRRFTTLLCAALLATGCAGDFGADRALPSCGARPILPPGYDLVRSDELERSDRMGTRQELRGPDGQRLVFHIGVRTGVNAADLPQVGDLPLATLGTARLSGRGDDWVLAWEEGFPCTEMAVVGTGFDQTSFVRALGFAQVIPFEAEEAEAGGEGEDLEELLEEELEGEGEEETFQPGGPSVEWVAVFDAGRDRTNLDPDAAELRDAAPTHAVIARASCWRGLPQRLGVPRDAYVAAVRAAVDHELDFAVERVDRTPIARGAFRSRCPG